MKLYSRSGSPFAARVRISIAAKALPIEIVDNPDVSSEAFGSLNPLRRVPVLQLEEGQSIAESETIVAYLEECYPETPLMPLDPLDRARVRLVARVADLYLFPAVVQVLMVAGAASSEDLERDRLLDVVQQRLSGVASFLEDKTPTWHSVGGQLSTADAALAPFLFYVELLEKRFGCSLMQGCPQMRRFWEGAQQDPFISPVLLEMGQAMHPRS